MKNIHIRCIQCGADDPPIRGMTAQEIERVGYGPEDRRVCGACETLAESLIEVEREEFEVNRLARLSKLPACRLSDSERAEVLASTLLGGAVKRAGV